MEHIRKESNAFLKARGDTNYEKADVKDNNKPISE